MFELIELIQTHKWTDNFNKAIERARKNSIPELADIQCLDDYLAWINNLLYWVPTENRSGREINDQLCKFHFILDQPPVLGLQNRITPNLKSPPLMPLSAWMVKFAKAMGEFLDTPESHVTVKNLHWSIGELMEGSPYQDRFDNGMFMHAFLSPTDYHRQHAPVGGTVLEARVIPGQVYLEVVAVPVPGDATGRHHLQPLRRLDTLDNTGYQFAQARGLIVLDSAIGLVAVLPIGMCQVSSVILTAEVGVTLRKGEELSYFQFGGSDIIVLFEAKSNVNFVAQPGVHYKMGTKIAQAYLAA